MTCLGALDQRLDHFPVTEEVTGSNPVRIATLFDLEDHIGLRSLLARFDPWEERQSLYGLSPSR